MRKRRRVLIALGVVIALAVAAFVLWPGSGRTGASLKALARLAPGMSAEEVAKLLGPPAADVTASPPSGVPPAAPGGRLLVYPGERATATIEFGPDGRLVRIHPVVRTVNLEERIRLRLNWW